MGFQFTLHAVLRARIIVEEREERLLQNILVEIAQRKREIEALEGEMARGNQARGETIFQHSIGRTLHGQYGEMQELMRVRDLLLGQLEKLDGMKAIQLVIYNAARQNRELLTEMRTTKREAYDTDLSRREQSTLDDNFIARRSLL